MIPSLFIVSRCRIRVGRHRGERTLAFYIVILAHYLPCVTLRFSRIMGDRMLPVLYGPSLIRKYSAVALTCTFTRSLTIRNHLVHDCRVTDSSPYASHYS
ncbi:hypothetical protein TNCV_301561 [Trichonephila clavipes]|nr:hypothetical protein TNCV_301561 [Trichonephila clavipes]